MLDLKLGKSTFFEDGNGFEGLLPEAFKLSGLVTQLTVADSKKRGMPYLPVKCKMLASRLIASIIHVTLGVVTSEALTLLLIMQLKGHVIIAWSCGSSTSFLDVMTLTTETSIMNLCFLSL